MWYAVKMASGRVERAIRVRTVEHNRIGEETLRGEQIGKVKGVRFVWLRRWLHAVVEDLRCYNETGWNVLISKAGVKQYNKE